MIDIKLIQTNANEVKENLSKRKFDISLIDEILSQDKKRKDLTQSVEAARAELNKLAKEIGMKKKANEPADDLVAKVSFIKNEMAQNDKSLIEIQSTLESLLQNIPNLIANDVPVGSSEDDNVEVFKFGEPKKFSFKPKDHVELGENLGGLDFETGAKITGSRFVVYKGQIAKLERALINFMLDQHSDNGYIESLPPYIVHEKSLIGTGQLPKFKEDLFKLEGTDWYLIPTAEVPLTNFKREELFSMDELPLKYAGYTPCFRSEAGSYGKDTKGLIRLHQFNKVELVNIVAADKSEAAHEDMINRARSILELLELPYRGLLLCSADIGFGARKCIDLEVWLPGQDKYREISSISNCWDFQARRAGIRYRNAQGKAEYAHTLNGSGLAVGRTLVSIMENYQNEDGSIDIPKVLQPYMRGVERITKS